MDYPIRAVSQITGLSIDTLRAWERRYGAVKPVHAARGRVYADSDIRRLGLLRELVNRGHAIGLVAGLEDADLRQLLDAATQIQALPPSPPDGEFAEIFAALANYDPAAVADALGRRAAVLSNRDMIYQVALPLMREIGDRWHAGNLSIAGEHMASEALRSLLGGLLRLHAPRSGAPTMVFAAPPEEWHEFGILCAAVLAAGLGLRAVYLGPNTPLEEVARVAITTSARVVVLSLTQPNPPTAPLRELEAALAPTIELWLGGTAAPDQPPGRRARKMGTLEDLERQCQRIVGIV